MDFFSLCEVNDKPLKEKYKELVLNSDDTVKELLQIFCQKVQDEGVITKNMKPMDLRNFLDSGKLLNIYEWAEEISRFSKTKDKDNIIEERLNKYYEKRKVFDEYFNEDDKPNYGALNIGGGLGAVMYGEFCVVFQPEVLTKGGKLGYLSADSLNRFVSVTLEVDEEGIKENCSTDTCKQFLATLKHSKDIPKVDSKDWAKILCGENEYVEAIFSMKVDSTNISSVRISKIDYDLYWEYAFEAFREKLSELDQYRIDTFRRITERLEENSLDWEVIEND